MSGYSNRLTTTIDQRLIDVCLSTMSADLDAHMRPGVSPAGPVSPRQDVGSAADPRLTVVRSRSGVTPRYRDPMVVVAFMIRLFEPWTPLRHPRSWHSRAGGRASRPQHQKRTIPSLATFGQARRDQSLMSEGI